MKKRILIIFTFIIIIFLLIGEYFFQYTFKNENYTGINIIQIDNKIYNKDKFVIISHGYKKDSDRMEIEKNLFLELGYSVILINNQSKYYTFGYKEKDIILDVLEKNKDKKFILYGMSMGASSTLQAAINLKNNENVKLIIVDSPYDDVYSVFKGELKKRFNLPSFPIMDIARINTYFHLGFDYKKIKVSDKINNISVPILFMHGLDDDFVLPKQSRKIFDNYNGEKEYVEFKDSKHTEYDQKNYLDYKNTIENFIIKYEAKFKK